MNRAVETVPAPGHEHAEGQQHPITIYLWIWALLFIFSTFSYLIDYFHLQGYLRWSLIGLMAIEGDYTFLTRLAAFLR
jgi:cytochrome c oxidase subunit IV